jgi:hypothetical protein
LIGTFESNLFYYGFKPATTIPARDGEETIAYAKWLTDHPFGELPRVIGVRQWLQTTDFGISLPVLQQILQALTGFNVQVRSGAMLQFARYHESAVVTTYFAMTVSGFVRKFIAQQFKGDDNLEERYFLLAHLTQTLYFACS